MRRPRGWVLVLAACAGLLLAAAGALRGAILSPAACDAPVRVAVVVGSSRVASNSAGVAAWAARRLRTKLGGPAGDGGGGESLALDVVDLARARLPATFEHVAARGAAGYDGVTRAWSARVSGWDGAVLVVPEYNGAMGGVLKTALDRLRREWRGMPVLVVGVGSAGGARVIRASRVVWAALALDVVAEVGVSLRDKEIAGRVRGDEAWLVDLEPELDVALRELLARAEARRDRRVERTCTDGKSKDV